MQRDPGIKPLAGMTMSKLADKYTIKRNKIRNQISLLRGKVEVGVVFFLDKRKKLGINHQLCQYYEHCKRSTKLRDLKARRQCQLREARLARGGIREHDAFLGHETRGPAGIGRGGVSMARGREGQSARQGNGVKQFRQIGAER